MFYEDFSDKWRHPGDKISRYAQRIDVDEWRFYVAEGVQVKGLNEVKPNELITAVFRIKKDFFDRITDALAGESIATEEDQIESDICSKKTLTSTVKEQLVKSRVGQGLFRENVQETEHCCRVSKVADPRFLIASHIKPWRCSNNQERLDGENGLLLSPNVDRLFDRGFISFMDDGTLLISPVADRVTLGRLGVPSKANVGGFTAKQKQYLGYHRREVFLSEQQDE